MTGLDRVRALVPREDGLAVVLTNRADGSGSASIVNAGVLDHPVTGAPVVAYVARGGTKKLANLRHRPQTTLVFRVGWEWVAVEGDADLAGPDDPLEGLGADTLPHLLRSVYAAAVGGIPEDWAELDRAMAAERHTAVLVAPERIYSNPAS